MGVTGRASDLKSLLSSNKVPVAVNQEAINSMTPYRGADSTTPYREYREYKLHDPEQGISGV